MTNFVDALQEKIDELEAEKERIDTKIELLQELLDVETEEDTAPPAPKKKRAGRPKGAKNRKKSAESKHAPEDDLYKQAMKELNSREGGGTSPELQEKLTRKFQADPRPTRELGHGITAGTKKQVEEAANKRKSNATVSIEDE